MNLPPQRWCNRYAAFVATLGAMASLVGPARPAVAAVHVPVLGSVPTLRYDAARACAGGVAPYGMGIDCALVGSTVGDVYANRTTVVPVAYDVAHGANEGTSARGTNRVAQGETVNVMIPREEGVLTMTVSNAPLELSAPVLSADKKTFGLTGQLPAVGIEDNRNQSQPGWSLSGQVSDFRGGGPGFSGSDLGWTPMVSKQNAAQDVAVGPAVRPGSDPGLKVGSSLAFAVATRGLGTTFLGAALDLKIAASISVGSQVATLTVTLVQHA